MTTKWKAVKKVKGVDKDWWDVDEARDDGDYLVAELGTGKVAEARARLIAQAPEQNDFLRELLKRYDEFVYYSGDDEVFLYWLHNNADRLRRIVR